MGVEHPVDAGPRRIAGTYPGVDLGDELVAFADPPVQALAAQDADLDLDHVEPAGVLRGVVELQPSQEAVSLLRRKGFVQRASGVGREIVLHHPDPVGFGVVDVHEVAQAAGIILCRALAGDRHLAPGAMHVEADEQIDGAVALVLVIIARRLSRSGRDRLADLADQLQWALVEADHRPPRIRLLGIEVEHILHAGHEAAIDLRDAPPVAAPRLELGLTQAPAHRLPRQRGMIGQPDYRIGQQLQGPASPTLGRAGAGGRHQQGFLLARQLARDTRPWRLLQGGRQVAFHEAALGAVHRRGADPDARGNRLVAAAGIGCEQDLRPLQLARRLPAATQHGRELVALRLAQLHPEVYVHRVPRASRARDGHHLPSGSTRLHAAAGTVPRIHPRLPAPARSRPGRNRHPALLPRQPTLGASDAADPRAGWVDLSATSDCSLRHPDHRSSAAAGASFRIRPTGQIFCAEVLVPLHRDYDRLLVTG